MQRRRPHAAAGWSRLERTACQQQTSSPGAASRSARARAASARSPGQHWPASWSSNGGLVRRRPNYVAEVRAATACAGFARGGAFFPSLVQVAALAEGRCARRAAMKRSPKRPRDEDEAASLLRVASYLARTIAASRGEAAREVQGERRSARHVSESDVWRSTGGCYDSASCYCSYEMEPEAADLHLPRSQRREQRLR